MRLLTLVLALAVQAAAGGMMHFDSTVHDFGKILLKDGPVTCSFTVTNGTDSPQIIQAVTTTCTCTKSEWTRKELKPGESGTVKVTFSNDEGAHPFDKTVCVYTSAESKPTVLHLRGIVKKN